MCVCVPPHFSFSRWDVCPLVRARVFVRGYIARVGGKQAAERKKHKRHGVKLDLTVSIGVGGKFDCSL